MKTLFETIFITLAFTLVPCGCVHTVQPQVTPVAPTVQNVITNFPTSTTNSTFNTEQYIWDNWKLR